MKMQRHVTWCWYLLGGLLLIGSAQAPAQSTPPWNTVVNNGDVMPGTLDTFNSYNQPSVNELGVVVFRARSKGGDGGGGTGGNGDGERTLLSGATSAAGGNGGSGSGGNQPVHGIYSRNMLQSQAPVVKIFDKSSVVPQPNNNGATFIEFPAFPRIDMLTTTVVTRGTSQPVWNYTQADGTDTRAGTSALLASGKQGAVAVATQLGSVPGYQMFQVPGAAPGVKFDQFPGSPAIGVNKVVFKGNYTENGVSKTGIFFRNPVNGTAAIQLIANSNTRIPNQPKNTNIPFGSTAPPSTALDLVVFAGFDNEDNPTMGGIYWAVVQSKPTLRALVGIGGQVPGEAKGTGFTRFGEALAFDGRNVAFWGAWGSSNDVRSITLACPADGNSDLIAYCNKTYPSGYTVNVPIHQGIFVYDTLFGTLTPVAKTPTNFDDFLYWTFSGKPPDGPGSFDGEPARWRSSAFTAVAGVLRPFQAVFKARKNTVDGIYLAGPKTPLTTLVDTSMPGTVLDGEAPLGSKVTSVGIERESLRGVFLTITASMLDPITSESWAGIYLRRLP